MGWPVGFGPLEFVRYDACTWFYSDSLGFILRSVALVWWAEIRALIRGALIAGELYLFRLLR
jgi:hypothetical protein